MLNKFFYILKPIILRKLQLFLRRKLILLKLSKNKDVWPILKGSEKKPEGFSDWSDNKQFALVLTHDVEHKKGYDRVLKLMQVEKELGFVSSFNFIPERDYVVEKELLDTLKENGFEFGVHGLYHDGKLFSSEKEFLKRAKKINQYLKEWGSVGFRAPSMHHNLDWIGELNISYDMSTFDTDPFEPQPDGVGTIFPFWIENKRHKNGGYVELPYTLPQDFTPFILMKEKTPKIWMNKLDWIAENNGMVLVNVHPDYISFNDTIQTEEFSIEIYRSFLNYISTRYKNNYWNVLPSELALFWNTIPKNNFDRLSTKKSLMVVYSYFPDDTRVRREANSLLQAGCQVDVVCLRSPGQNKIDNFEGINIFRINLSKIRSTKLTYISLYFVFFILAFIKINRLYIKNKYDVIHVHNMPDFLVFAAIIQKLFGTKIVLDLHDPMPEVFYAKYGSKGKKLSLKIVKFQEKLSFRFAHKIITTNLAFIEAFKSRGNDISKIRIVINSPQESVFNTKPYLRETKDKNKFIIMYHGTLVERHGLDVAIASVKELKTTIPELEFWIYGKGEFLTDVLALIKENQLEDTVFYKGAVILDEIAKTIPMIDLGIIPNKLSPFTNINFPVRIFEYIYFKKPVIVPKTKGISDYFKNDEIFYFKSEDTDDLSEKILNVYRDPETVSKTIDKSYKVFEKYRWSIQKENLIDLYKNL